MAVVERGERINFAAPTDQAGGASERRTQLDSFLAEIDRVIPAKETAQAEPAKSERLDLLRWKVYLRDPEAAQKRIGDEEKALGLARDQREIAEATGENTSSFDAAISEGERKLKAVQEAIPAALRGKTTTAEAPRKSPYDELVERLAAYVRGKPAAEAPKAQAPREVPGTESEEDHLKRLQKEIGEGSWKIAPGIRGKNLIDELVFYLSHGGTIDLTNSSLFDASKNLYLTPVAQDFIRECVQRAQEIIETKTEPGRASNGESAQAGAAQAPAAEQRQGSEFAGLREKLNEDNWWVMSGIEDALRKMVEAEGVIIDISKIKLPADETLKGIITARINDINESARARAEAGAAQTSDTGERNEEERGNDSGKLSWWKRVRRRVLGNRTENAPESMYKDVEYKNPDGTAMDEGQTRAIQAKVRAIAGREDLSEVSDEDLELVERYLNLDAINPAIRKKIQAALKR